MPRKVSPMRGPALRVTSIGFGVWVESIVKVKSRRNSTWNPLSVALPLPKVTRTASNSFWVNSGPPSASTCLTFHSPTSHAASRATESQSRFPSARSPYPTGAPDPPAWARTFTIQYTGMPASA